MIHLVILALFQSLQNNIVGIYVSLAITLVFVAAVTLLIVWFIPMIDELKHLIVGLAVMAAIFIWMNINLLP